VWDFADPSIVMMIGAPVTVAGRTLPFFAILKKGVA
jgi:hypothetical protein